MHSICQYEESLARPKRLSKAYLSQVPKFPQANVWTLIFRKKKVKKKKKKPSLMTSKILCDETTSVDAKELGVTMLYKDDHFFTGPLGHYMQRK